MVLEPVLATVMRRLFGGIVQDAGAGGVLVDAICRTRDGDRALLLRSAQVVVLVEIGHAFKPLTVISWMSATA